MPANQPHMARRRLLSSSIMLLLLLLVFIGCAFALLIKADGAMLSSALSPPTNSSTSGECSHGLQRCNPCGESLLQL